MIKYNNYDKILYKGVKYDFSKYCILLIGLDLP